MSTTMYPEKPHALLDKLQDKHHLKNDAALARELGIQPPIISKIRSHVLAVSCESILKIHERYDMPVTEIRRLIALANTQVDGAMVDGEVESETAGA